MEARLFWIGIIMMLYAWLCREWTKAKAINSPLRSGLWHGLFMFISGFSATLVIVMSLESRTRFFAGAVNSPSTGEIYPSLAVALIAGSIGFWRAWQAGHKAEKRRYYLREDQEWADTVFSAVLLASVLMYFVLQAFKIPSGSMRKTFLEGDHLFVNKFIYGLRVPLTGKRILSLRSIKREDVIVFRFPSDDPKVQHCGSIQYGKDFIKRVIGLPGDEIEVRDGRVRVNGKELVDADYAQYVDKYRQPMSYRVEQLGSDRYQYLWENGKLDAELQDILRDQFGPVTVPAGSYMVMGDNRDRSCDSRYWGPVAMKYVKGKAWFIYFPFSRMGKVR